MYEELVKALRDDNACLSIKTAHEAADAIEKLENWWSMAKTLSDMVMPKWIPVTERCPEKSGDYLVFDDCRNLYVNEWHCLLKKWQYDDSRITHWMPLPEPPKEGTE